MYKRQVGHDALLAMAQSYRHFALSNPGIYELVLQAPAPDDEEMTQLSEEFLAILSLILNTYGLQEEATLHAIRGLRSLLHGFVSLETSGGFGLPLDLDDSFSQMVHAYLRGLQTASV